MGVGQFLKQKSNKIQIYPLEPHESPTLSIGQKIGNHRIQGISDEFIPSIVNLNNLNDVVSVHDGDAIILAQKISASLDLGVGISSGANFIGALKVQNELGANSTVITVFPDDNKKYLSTDLLRKEPVKKDYLSQDIEFIDFQAFKRVCHTCCDFPECNQQYISE